MNIELHEIKYIRKRLELTQKQLANRAGVSQSLIAKVEAGRIEPTYSNCKRIFDVLEHMNTEKECVAHDVMNKKLVLAEENEDLAAIVKAMKKYDISQVPVTRNKNPIGLITESVIIEKMLEIKDSQKIAAVKAKDIMLECPPIISPETKQSAVMTLLKHFSVILVAEQGNLQGLITKADILELIQK